MDGGNDKRKWKGREEGGRNAEKVEGMRRKNETLEGRTEERRDKGRRGEEKKR